MILRFIHRALAHPFHCCTPVHYTNVIMFFLSILLLLLMFHYDNTWVNIPVTPPRHYSENFSRGYTRNSITGSCIMNISNLTRCLPSSLQSGYTHLNTPSGDELLVFHISPTLGFVRLSNFCQSDEHEMGSYVLICIPFISSKLEHVFIY